MGYWYNIIFGVILGLFGVFLGFISLALTIQNEGVKITQSLNTLGMSVIFLVTAYFMIAECSHVGSANRVRDSIKKYESNLMVPDP